MIRPNTWPVAADMFSARVKVPACGELVSATWLPGVPVTGVGMVTGGSTVASPGGADRADLRHGVDAGAVLAGFFVGDALAAADAAAATVADRDAAGITAMAGLVLASAVAVSVTAVTTAQAGRRRRPDRLGPGREEGRQEALGHAAVAVAKAAYKYSGAQDVVSCVTDPHLSSCIKAAVTVALVIATAGEGEVEVAAMNAAEEAGGSVAERVGARVAESCGLSFTPGTKVLLANGKAVPISTLKPGEKVVSTSTKTGTTRAGTIAAVLVHHDTNRYDLTVRARGRTAVIHTTSNHPFWDATTGRWVKTGALRYGTRLRTPSGGTATVLGGHAPRDRSGWMWDLTIPGNHDFYIATTAADILVHNCTIPADRTRMATSDALDTAESYLGQGYREPIAGSGRYVSSDGTRVVRMSDSDITGAHGGGPHMNFEELAPNPARPGRMMVTRHSHVYLIDP